MLIPWFALQSNNQLRLPSDQRVATKVTRRERSRGKMEADRATHPRR